MRSFVRCGGSTSQYQIENERFEHDDSIDTIQPLNHDGEAGYRWHAPYEGSHFQKLDFIAEIRVITGLGFRDAENIINSAPTLIKEGISSEAAQEIKERLEALGAVVKIL